MLSMLFTFPFSSFDLNHGANIVKGYALAAGVIFAIWIGYTWWRRKLAADRIEVQVRAKQAFARFTHQVMQQPELAAPVPADAGVNRARYQKYVELLLTTADEILLLDPSQEWRAALGRQLSPHVEIMASPALREGLYGILSKETQELVEKTLVAAGGTGSNVRPLRAGKA